MALAKAMNDYESVQTWLKGLRAQWAREPDDVEGSLATLQRFCTFVEREPDAIIAECSREVESGKRIRIKARRSYAEKIVEFEASVEGDTRTQTRAGNTVRSFMIHNGIFMQAGLQA